MARIRVLQVTETLGLGGLEQVVVTLCRSLDRREFESSVLCLTAGGPFEEDLRETGIPVHVVARTPGTPDYLSFLKARRFLREHPADVVHTHNTGAFLFGGLGAKLAGVRTLVHTDHARAFPDKMRYMVAEHIMSHLAYRLVGVSEDTTRSLRHYERIPERKLLTIPNGIDAARYDIAVDVAAKRRELGLAPGARVVGIAARLNEEKGVGYLLQAAALLRRTIPKLVVLICGSGPLELDLKATASELGIDENVRFLGLRRDIPELLKVFEVSVISSVREGLPMAVLEAMAAGCPMVSTDVGGIRTAIAAGETGLLVPSRDPERLAAAIGELLLDDARRERFGQNSRVRFRERFTVDAMVASYARLYRRGGEIPAPPSNDARPTPPPVRME